MFAFPTPKHTETFFQKGFARTCGEANLTSEAEGEGEGEGGDEDEDDELSRQCQATCTPLMKLASLARAGPFRSRAADLACAPAPA